jgi:two-component system, OmpR family, sensor histidine kinase ChvG
VSLRLQLLFFGLLTLALPWAGMRVVREMEGALRNGVESSVLASARTVAAALANRLADDEEAERAFQATRARPGLAVYAHPLRGALQIDGRRDDWRAGDLRGTELAPGYELWAGTYGRFAYLFVEVADPDRVVQSSPGQTPYGDRVVLLVEGRDEPSRWLTLSTGAPGAFRARYAEPGSFAPTVSFEDRVVAAWRETGNGFAVEARIPLGLVDSGLGVAIIDVDHVADGYTVSTISSWDTTGTDDGVLVFRREGVQAAVDEFTQMGSRFRVLDAAGWVLADTGGIVPSDDPLAGTGGLAERFFGYALRRDDPSYASLERPAGHLADPSLRGALANDAAVAWYRDGPGDSAVVAAAAPIRAGDTVIGAVLLEQASDPILTLTNRALLRLVTLTLAISTVAALALLGYASFLSWRVQRLARAAEAALGPRGEINVVLPGMTAPDELGDLARTFGDLLGRLRDYTGYLRTLTGKLAHELRTPLAVVSTSLDNLAHEVREPAAAPYLQRLRDGAARLDSIIEAMSAATRIEQAVTSTPVETIDLAAIVGACVRAYRDVYPDTEFAGSVPQTPCVIDGSGELVAQLLDKLVENAVSFRLPGTPVSVDLRPADTEFVLSVANQGPLLPDAMRQQVFDSLVSLRPYGDGSTHLGLGLYVVALIARFHGGRIAAENQPDASGVVVSVAFPRRANV